MFKFKKSLKKQVKDVKLTPVNEQALKSDDQTFLLNSMLTNPEMVSTIITNPNLQPTTVIKYVKASKNFLSLFPIVESYRPRYKEVYDVVAYRTFTYVRNNEYKQPVGNPVPRMVALLSEISQYEMPKKLVRGLFDEMFKKRLLIDPNGYLETNLMFFILNNKCDYERKLSLWEVKKSIIGEVVRGKYLTFEPGTWKIIPREETDIYELPFWVIPESVNLSPQEVRVLLLESALKNPDKARVSIEEFLNLVTDGESYKDVPLEWLIEYALMFVSGLEG